MEYDHFRSKAELEAGVKFWQVFSPVLIIFGTFGNVSSILILSRSPFNKWASTVYLLALAVADLCMLYVGLLRQWVRYTFDTDIRHTSSVVCKVHWWLMYVTADCTVWILTTITIERLLSTLYPYRSKALCTKNVAKIMLTVIVTTALLINSHLLYGFGRLEIQEGNTTIAIPCAPLTDSYDRFFSKIWTWIDLCKFSLIPFAILSSGNVCIIYKLIKSGEKVKSDLAQKSQTNKNTSNMSVLLVALNCMFILCTLPICIYFIGEPFWIPKDIPRKIQLEDPWWALVNFLWYLNNSTNFIFYCVSGSRFRKSVKELFEFGRNKIAPSFVTLDVRANVRTNNATGLRIGQPAR